MKNSLNFMSTCLKVVDTRRAGVIVVKSWYAVIGEVPGQYLTCTITRPGPSKAFAELSECECI
jgi:hypothetical protein